MTQSAVAEIQQMGDFPPMTQLQPARGTEPAGMTDHTSSNSKMMGSQDPFVVHLILRLTSFLVKDFSLNQSF